MRVALAGKGGAGKTTIAATMARLIARDHAVVAVDADSNPNLAAALGVEADADLASAVVPSTVVSRRLDGAALTEPVRAVVERFAVAAPDGVRLLLMGAPAHADEGCLCSAHATVSAVLADVGALADTATVIDMEASPEHLSRGTARHVDTLLLVTEPYYRSLETARRMATLARELPIPRIAVVANKLRNPGERDAIAEFCARHELELAAAIPRSDVVVDADTAGVPLLDHLDRLAAADSDVVAAIAALAEQLVGTVTLPAGR